MDAVLRALDFVTELTNQAPLRSILSKQIHTGRGETRSMRERWVRGTTKHMHHAVGTCRIGTQESGVVDSELRVHGLTGLRVADASIMPQITSGDTNATTIMIGEKAADLIRGITPAGLPEEHQHHSATACPYLAALPTTA